MTIHLYKPLSFRLMAGCVGIVSVLLFSPGAWAISGDEVMRKVQDQARIHKTQKYDVYMEVFDSKDRKRERFFTSWKKVKGAASKSLVRFYQPADIKNTGLLSHGNDNRLGADQWIYLPAFKSVKKLSGADKHNSFMGSDFSNADVAGRTLKEDKHELLNEDDNAYYVVSLPVSAKDQYSKLEYKIHRDIFVPLEVIFYDRKGQKLKTLSNRKIRKVKGMYVVVESEMRNLQKNSRTNILIRSTDVGLRLNDSLFTTKGLRL